jgi:hypothetical protein
MTESNDPMMTGMVEIDVDDMLWNVVENAQAAVTAARRAVEMTINLSRALGPDGCGDRDRAEQLERLRDELKLHERRLEYLALVAFLPDDPTHFH